MAYIPVMPWGHAFPDLMPEPAKSTGRPLFPAAPRPDQVVAHPAWRAALSEVQTAMARASLAAIVGMPGTGKTLLLSAIAQQLEASGRTAALLRPGSPPGGAAPDVVLIDDADPLAPAMLAALARSGRPSVVTGGLGLGLRLRASDLPVTVVTLRPLTADEAAAFLRGQLVDAGPADLLQPAALMQVVQRSNGVPRSLQMLAGLSVFVARLADAPQVTPAHVEQASLIQAGTDGGDAAEDESEAPAAPPVNPPVAPSAILPAISSAVLAAQPPPVLTVAAALPADPESPRRMDWAMVAGVAGLLGVGAAAGWLALHEARPAADAGSSPVTVARPLPVVRAGAVPPAQPVPPMALAEAPPVPEPPAPAGRTVQPPTGEAEPVAAEPAVAPVPPAPVPANLSASSQPVRTRFPLPPAAPVHVVVAFEQGNPALAQRAATVTDALRRMGFEVPPPEPGSTRGEPAVSYAFAEDAPVAALVARGIGLEATQVRPAALTRPGTVRIAIWAPGTVRAPSNPPSARNPR